MEKSDKRLGEILIAKGYITEADLAIALMDQKSSDQFIGLILIEKGMITSRKLAEGLSEQFKLPLVDIKAQHIDLEITRRFSSSLVQDHKCFPFSEDESSVTVAIVNPLDGVAFSSLAAEANPKTISLVIVSEDEMKELLQNYKQYVNQSIQRMLWKKKPIPGIGGQ